MSTESDTDLVWLSDEEQRSWRAYLRGNRLLNEALDDALATHDVRLTEYEILSMLSEAPGGRLRMSALADLVVQSRSRLTHTASRLESRGWVNRVSCLDDRRGVELVLTEEGSAVLQQLAVVHVRSVRAAFVDLMTPEEFAALGRAMGKVVEGLGEGPTT